MPGNTHHLLVVTTFPDIDTAQRVAQHIVQAKLAACVNILPPGISIYIWEGKECRETEHVALIKTTEHCYTDLETFIKQQHPYELPEVIATPITKGSENYLSWLTTSTTA